MTKKLLIYIFCILSTVAAHAIDPRLELLLDDIEKATSAADWERADSLTVAAMRIDPSNPNNVLLLSNLGMIRFYNGQDSLAIETLSHAQRMAPGSVTVLANRARVLTATGDIPAALADYDAIEKLDSLYSDTYLFRGFILLNQGDFARAEADFDRLKQLAPGREDTAIALASLYSLTARPEQAVEQYNKLINHERLPEYLAARALCEIQLDRLADASDDISEGLQLDPLYSELYLARALLNTARYEQKAAREDAQRALELGADPARIKAILSSAN